MIVGGNLGFSSPQRKLLSSSSSQRNLQAVSAAHDWLLKTTIARVVETGLLNTQNLMEVNILSFVDSGDGRYSVAYELKLEQSIPCDEDQLITDQEACNALLADTVAAALSDAIADGTFASLLRLNALECGADCASFQNASVYESSLGSLVVVSIVPVEYEIVIVEPCGNTTHCEGMLDATRMFEDLVALVEDSVLSGSFTQDLALVYHHSERMSDAAGASLPHRAPPPLPGGLPLAQLSAFPPRVGVRDPGGHRRRR